MTGSVQTVPVRGGQGCSHLHIRRDYAVMIWTMEEEKKAELDERPVFAHPSWIVGVVLIFAVLFIAMGLVNQVWLLIGFPCILVLLIYVYVRLFRKRDRQG